MTEIICYKSWPMNSDINSCICRILWYHIWTQAQGPLPESGDQGSRCWHCDSGWLSGSVALRVSHGDRQAWQSRRGGRSRGAGRPAGRLQLPPESSEVGKASLPLAGWRLGRAAPVGSSGHHNLNSNSSQLILPSHLHMAYPHWQAEAAGLSFSVAASQAY